MRKRIGKKAPKNAIASARLKNRGRAIREEAQGEVAGFTDLSQYEDQMNTSFLEEVGRRAARNAVNENRAMGIPVTFLHNGWVVRRMPDGSIVKLSQVIQSIQSTPARKLKKGTVIHVRKASH